MKEVLVRLLAEACSVPPPAAVRAESCAFTSVQYMTQTTILTTASNNTLKIWVR
jgi:hypothetical protein